MEAKYFEHFFFLLTENKVQVTDMKKTCERPWLESPWLGLRCTANVHKDALLTCKEEGTTHAGTKVDELTAVEWVNSSSATPA